MQDCKLVLSLDHFLQHLKRILCFIAYGLVITSPNSILTTSRPCNIISLCVVQVHTQETRGEANRWQVHSHEAPTSDDSEPHLFLKQLHSAGKSVISSTGGDESPSGNARK